MVCVDLSDLYTNAKGTESISEIWVPIPSDRVITGMTVSRRDRFKCRCGILHILKVFPLPDSDDWR
jgi:hypothetical protein